MADLTKHSDSEQPVATKSFTQTWTTATFKFVPPFELRYFARYDYGKPGLYEWYELWEKHVTLIRGRTKWRPKFYYIEACKMKYRGDIEWAKKLAKDLGIDVPEPTHRLSAWRPKTARAKSDPSNPPSEPPLNTPSKENT